MWEVHELSSAPGRQVNHKHHVYGLRGRTDLEQWQGSRLFPRSNSTYFHHELLMPTRSKRCVKVLLRATSGLTLLTDRYIGAEVCTEKGPIMLQLY